MTLTDWLNKAAIFVPEIKPLIPAIVAAVTVAQKIDSVLAPAIARLEADEAAFLELGEATPQLEQMMPDIAAALKTYQQLKTIGAAYATKLGA